MATKQLTVVRPGRYGTRMLQAGDPLEVSAPDARLYLKLGWAEERTVRRAAPKAAEPTEEKPAKRTRRRKKTA